MSKSAIEVESKLNVLAFGAAQISGSRDRGAIGNDDALRIKLARDVYRGAHYAQVSRTHIICVWIGAGRSNKGYRNGEPDHLDKSDCHGH
jgi:hypothetical protein